MRQRFELNMLFKAGKYDEFEEKSKAYVKNKTNQGIKDLLRGKLKKPNYAEEMQMKKAAKKKERIRYIRGLLRKLYRIR